MGVMLKLFSFVMSFLCAPAQRYFDPWSSAFDDKFGFFNRGLPPCPEYQPMRVSNWEKLPTGYFLLRGTLPSVRSDARNVWLDQDGTMLHIKAVRPVPARGRQCLPPTARISSDGRFEVYEASMPLPRAANAAGGTVRQTSNGIEVVMPFLPAVNRPSPSPANVARETAMAGATHEAHMKPTKKSWREEKQLRLTSQDTERKVSGKTRVNPTRMPKAQPKIPEGIEVIDMEPEEPLKNPDASGGWYDNRGDFQLY